MSLIRTEVSDLVYRWREVIAAAVIGLFGMWCIGLGGWLLMPFGAAVMALALAIGVLGVRRLRFGNGGAAPGMVEVIEGQVAYYGPGTGGFVALAELVEVRLMARWGQRIWRLKQADGQVLLIPAAAEGAGLLFDAFASLPGMDTQAMVAALNPSGTPKTPTGTALGVAGADRDTSGQETLGRIIWQRRHLVAAQGRGFH